MCHIQIGVYYRQEIVTTLDIMQYLGTVYIYGHNPYVFIYANICSISTYYA